MDTTTADLVPSATVIVIEPSGPRTRMEIAPQMLTLLIPPDARP